MDWVYRLAQHWGGRAVVLEAWAPACGGGRDQTQGCVCTIVLQVPPYASTEAGFVWLQVPEVSQIEWHPFECVSTTVSNGGAAMTIHVKAYDRWTRRLVGAVRERGAALRVRAEGPYPDPPAWADRPGDDAVVIVAGGIGVAAVLSLFNSLPPSPLLPLLLVWSTRSPAELLVLAPRVIEAVRERGILLTARVHFTGALDALARATATTGTPRLLLNVVAPSSASWIEDKPQSDQESSRGVALVVASKDPKALGTAPSALRSLPPPQRQQPGHAPTQAPASEASATPLCPVLLLGGSLEAQAVHKLAVHVLAFAGALAAILLVRGYSVVWAEKPWPTIAAGAAYAGAIAAFTVLPGLLAVVLPRLAAAIWSSARRACCGAGASLPDAVAPQLDSAAPASRASVSDDVGPKDAQHRNAPGHVARVVPTALKGGLVEGATTLQLALPTATGDEYVPLHFGRPETRRIVGGWLASMRQLPAGAREAPLLQVGCYGMGPDQMVSDAQLMCREMNAQQRRGARQRGVYMRCERKSYNL